MKNNVTGEVVMTFARFVAMTREQREEWLRSDEHLHNCAAWSEGQLCCLEEVARDE